MRILKINNSILLLFIKKDSVKCIFFFPISFFNWFVVSNKIEIKDLTVKLVVDIYKDLEKEYAGKYRV